MILQTQLSHIRSRIHARPVRLIRALGQRGIGIGIPFELLNVFVSLGHQQHAGIRGAQGGGIDGLLTGSNGEHAARIGSIDQTAVGTVMHDLGGEFQ